MVKKSRINWADVYVAVEEMIDRQNHWKSALPQDEPNHRRETDYDRCPDDDCENCPNMIECKYGELYCVEQEEEILVRFQKNEPFRSALDSLPYTRDEIHINALALLNAAAVLYVDSSNVDPARLRSALIQTLLQETRRYIEDATNNHGGA